MQFAAAGPLGPYPPILVLNVDADGKPGNNLKPPNGFPLATTNNADGSWQVVPNAQQKSVLVFFNLANPGPSKKVAGAVIVGPDWAAWITPGAPKLVLPLAYAYNNTDFQADHVGFDVPGTIVPGQPYPFIAPTVLGP